MLRILISVQRLPSYKRKLLSNHAYKSHNILQFFAPILSRQQNIKLGGREAKWNMGWGSSSKRVYTPTVLGLGDDLDK